MVSTIFQLPKLFFLIFPNLHTYIATPKKTQEVAASNHVFITVSSVRQMCQDSSQADSYLRVGEAASGLNVILDCVSDIQNFVAANHHARHSRNEHLPNSEISL